MTFSLPDLCNFTNGKDLIFSKDSFLQLLEQQNLLVLEF